MERGLLKMINWIAYICFIGAIISFGLGALGLFKFPDPYTRMHGVSIGDTLGVGLIGLGLLLLSPTWMLRIKIIAILILFWIINPTMTHMLTKAAIIHGTKPTKGTRIRKG